MRKWSLLVATVVFMMIGSPAALAQGKPQTAAYSTCVAKKINIDQMGHVTPHGGCTLAGKPIASVPVYRYTALDADSYSCGVVSGMAGRGKFTLQPTGVSKATGRVWYLPRAKYVKINTKASKPRSFQAHLSGSADLQCGKPVGLPATAALCATYNPHSFPDYLKSTCGKSVPGACAFTSPLTFDGTVLRVGHVSCPSGVCAYVLNHDEAWNGPGPGPFTDGLGGTFYRQRLKCGDGMGAVVGIGIAEIYKSISPDWACTDVAGATGLSLGGLRLSIPSSLDLNGQVYVAAYIFSYRNWSTTHERIGMFEPETAGFPLTGRTPPC